MKLFGLNITRATEKSIDGQQLGAAGGWGELGSWFGMDSLDEGWQRNLDRKSFSADKIPAVYACVMSNARAVSQCPIQVIRKDANRKDFIQYNSPVFRVLENPNSYETRNQFVQNMVAMMLFQGESFAYAIRDNRGVVSQLHRLNKGTCTPYIEPETKTIFYAVGSNPLVDNGTTEALIPQRDILHLRAHCPRHPLIGESPIKAAAMATGINVALTQSQLAFFNRMSRPSGIITSDMVLNKAQMEQLREAWTQQSAQMAQGGIPILGGGMKFQQLGINSQDAQLIQAQRFSIADISRVFGVPSVLINEYENASYNNVEQLVSLWLSMSLGSLIENVESSLAKFFGVRGESRIEIDESALLRMDFAARIDGLTKGVQGGLYTPNEARQAEDLPNIDGGDSVYLQQQMVPLADAQSQRQTNESKDNRLNDVNRSLKDQLSRW